MEHLQRIAVRDGQIILDASFLVASASVWPQVFAIRIIDRRLAVAGRLPDRPTNGPVSVEVFAIGIMNVRVAGVLCKTSMLTQTE